jgi:hypothetical protein
MFALPDGLRAAGVVWLLLALTFPTLPTALQASLWSSTEESQSEREEDSLLEVQDILVEAPQRSQRHSGSATLIPPAHNRLRRLHRAVESPEASEFARRNGMGSVLRC